MQRSSDKYIQDHSTLPCEALTWLERQTNIRTNYPRMLSGRVQGELLKLLVQISGARRILEIGAFTGYSSICMACGIPEDGHIDTLEINDELEDLIREGWERAGVSHLITLHIGDAKETLLSLYGEEGTYPPHVRKGQNRRTRVPLSDMENHVHKGINRPESVSPGYDMVFMDANKREYCEYYELVMPLLKSGGIIVADDVLWDGKVYADPLPHDAQTTGLLKFNDMVMNDPRVETVMLPLRDGLSIIRKK